jgi:hypothetical protein
MALRLPHPMRDLILKPTFGQAAAAATALTGRLTPSAVPP